MKSVQEKSTSAKFDITNYEKEIQNKHLKTHNGIKLSLAERKWTSANVINKSVHPEKVFHLAIEYYARILTQCHCFLNSIMDSANSRRLKYYLNGTQANPNMQMRKEMMKLQIFLTYKKLVNVSRNKTYLLHKTSTWLETSHSFKQYTANCFLKDCNSD